MNSLYSWFVRTLVLILVVHFMTGCKCETRTDFSGGLAPRTREMRRSFLREGHLYGASVRASHRHVDGYAIENVILEEPIDDPVILAPLLLVRDKIVHIDVHEDGVFTTQLLTVFPELRELVFIGCDDIGSRVHFLSQLPRLTDMAFIECAVTREDIVDLSGFETLKRVTFEDCNVTADLMAVLENTGIKVYWDYAEHLESLNQK